MYTVLGYPTNLSWWAFFLAVFISFAFCLPIGIIQAITNTQIGLNVLTEFIYGYIQPGRPLALMLYVPHAPPTSHPHPYFMFRGQFILVRLVGRESCCIYAPFTCITVA